MRFLSLRYAIGLVVAAGLALGGCTGGGTPEAGGTSNGKPAEAGKQLKVGIVFDLGGRGDKSFNDSAWRGIDRAKVDLGIEPLSIESKAPTDYETNLTAMADKNCDLVFAIGFAMKEAVAKVAKAYPNVKFALVDDVAEGANVRSLTFKEEEGSFLAGFLAGLMTTSGKIGFVGGMDMPLITKFYCGYVAGAKTANGSVEVLPAKYTGNWDNVDSASVAANVLFNGGADVVYHAAGKAGLGVINAAQDHQKFAIGVDSDQDDLAKGFVLTSMIKRVDEAVFQTIKDLKDGKFNAGQKVYALKDGGVGLSEMTYTKDKIGQANLIAVKMIGDRIKAGDVKVPATQEELAKYVADLKGRPAKM